MKLTLNWLKDHLETEASLDTIVATLTKIGLEVEEVKDPARALGGFVIAAVLEAKPHPNADRLRVCTVDFGAAAPMQVVCGAPNARAGMKSVFAPVGTYIPGKKTTLGPGVIRGVESNGMLCSAAELELSEEHDGILDLPGEAPVGTPYAQWVGLDPVIDINLTPNRPDAMGIAGIARDLAAAGLGTVKTPAVAPITGGAPSPVTVRIALDGADAALAPVFALRGVSGVKNGPAPDWLQAKLRSVGLRPINALVDITNFLTFDRARPLHVFDAKKVSGGLVVRRAAPGETLKALDGKTYTLDASMVVIADDSGVISLAGIMGGEATGCDETTTDVLIEAALWSPNAIAATGRKLGIVSDARYRFERGIDPAFTLPGLDLATRLVLDLCGGTASGVTLAGTVPEPDTRILFPYSEVRRLTGLDLPSTEMLQILEALGFQLAGSPGNADLIYVKVPSWRPDIFGKADLVEEVIRIAGVDRVVSTPLPRQSASIPAAILTPLQKRTRQAKRALAASGLVEAVTWSFVSHEQAVLFGGGEPALVLANPIASDLSDMRPSLLPGLIAAVGRNAARGAADLALFEVGQIFKGDGDKDQRIAVAAVRSGTAKPSGGGRHWSGAAGSVDAFDAKADAMALLDALGVPTGGLQVVAGGASAFHPGRSAVLRFGPKGVLGSFGEIHPSVLAAMDVAGPLVGFELILDDIPAPKSKPTKAKARLDLSDFMPLQRDFAFVVDRGVEAGAIVKAALGAERTLVTHVAVFDIYEGQGVPPGQKSVAITATIQPRDQTLKDNEIEAVMGKIIADVTKKTGAVLRG
ncbi:phenylalanine--tRNA ligase subunit beta [Beijerinckia sp. L45]|uniref:phenylalanine--tRNA ligase subunit beta n=1 Tax=Beijerinckia sp. L45 TaxID=1641855 RepID=UPI00131D6DCE|nr:phenylalanine--tRNA ligase subunit beta [Beijerinckia sp. L45]